MTTETLHVRVEFKGDLLKKFEAIKKHYGLENATEVMRILVHDKYRQLSK